ncbi:L,D-transpeptidase family protein [Streptomyces sp. NRRL S-920]|uniref:L,D-transpeptidase family protein n=1 Tax=Streptomyces sp. NRRL S-920 TaxID=1463921 RepID=UPI0004C57271|nr:L,D-transpeptidase family protein [Streptomyces sp. NRRL S-920]
MRIAGAVRVAVAAAACGVLLTSCGSGSDDSTRTTKNDGGAGQAKGGGSARQKPADLKSIPDVGDRLQSKIPKDSRQVVAVYGDGEDSAKSTVVLFTKTSKADATWEKARSWPAHNGKKGWTTAHRENDKRSPVGVFTLTDAGGVLADPGAKFPYTKSDSMQAPHYWPRTHWHDFDYVIAIDYNRAKGTPPNDPTRPQGQAKGGSIWLHMDHGSGTSGCVSLSKAGMEHLLRTLDPKQHPVVVMGDRANLKA